MKNKVKEEPEVREEEGVKMRIRIKLSRLWS